MREAIHHGPWTSLGVPAGGTEKEGSPFFSPGPFLRAMFMLVTLQDEITSSPRQRAGLLTPGSNSSGPPKLRTSVLLTQPSTRAGIHDGVRWACEESKTQDSTQFLTLTLKRQSFLYWDLSYRIQVLKQQDVFASLLQSIPLIISFWMYNLKGHQINKQTISLLFLLIRDTIS